MIGGAPLELRLRGPAVFVGCVFLKSLQRAVAHSQGASGGFTCVRDEPAVSCCAICSNARAVRAGTEGGGGVGKRDSTHTAVATTYTLWPRRPASLPAPTVTWMRMPPSFSRKRGNVTAALGSVRRSAWSTPRNGVGRWEAGGAGLVPSVVVACAPSTRGRCPRQETHPGLPPTPPPRACPAYPPPRPARRNLRRQDGAVVRHPQLPHGGGPGGATPSQLQGARPGYAGSTGGGGGRGCTTRDGVCVCVFV
jgi:hypothetical protein